MGSCPDTIKKLVDRFTQQSDQIRSPDYNETLIPDYSFRIGGHPYALQGTFF